METPKPGQVLELHETGYIFSVITILISAWDLLT